MTAMVRLKITKIGDALGVVLPADVLAAMKVTDDETLYLTETPTGYRISPHDPELEEQLRVGREVMDKHREVLQALSKS
jgi:putative addiction module antidote